MDDRRFMVIDPKDGANVHGQGVALERDDPYIAHYGIPLPDQKHVDELGVHQSTLYHYFLSGEKGVYKVLRVN